MPESWEIWWARVKFEDSEECKVRPVIVLEDAVAYIISLKVTRHAPRNNYAGEYVLLDWQEEGLQKESTV